MKIQIPLLAFLCCTFFVNAQNKYTGVIDHIDIVNWTHTDYGFTDHPLIVMELQKRYIDIAIDLAEKTKTNKEDERFTWTVEALDPLFKWWQETEPTRQEMLLHAIDRGQIDVSALPFNIHPMLNDVETDLFTHWIPDDLWAKLKPRLAVQNDVNGFPRAVARQLADKGVRYIWLGMNGRHPFPIPTLSWWQLSDGKKVLLWNGASYWDGFDYFHSGKWRTNQREASNLLYRWPRNGEFFRSDSASVRKAHAICLEKLAGLESKGYALPLLPITFSNQWRCDNDGPYEGIVAFVKKWNEMGLQPALRLSTATKSMRRLEQCCTKETKTLTGEFGDWWAFGLAALPRETAVARQARYTLQASVSPLLGALNEKVKKRTESVNRDLCTFYEHTFAASTASSGMYEPLNQGSINEVNRYAYKALEFAKWQLAQRVRSQLADQQEGIYIFNTQKGTFSGWISIEFTSLRDKKATGLIDMDNGTKIKFRREGQMAHFWVEGLEGMTRKRFTICNDSIVAKKTLKSPGVTLDKQGWPVAIVWPGMKTPLYEGNVGNLSVYSMEQGGWWNGDAQVKLYPNSVEKGGTKTIHTGYSTVYSQELTNERLVSAKRIVEVYDDQPRVNLKVVYNRKLHADRVPEFIYVEFPFPKKESVITTSNGGSVFTPYQDNIPNTCKTFYVADSWVAYRMDDGLRVWASRTSPLISFGQSVEFYRKGDAVQPQDKQMLQSMVYNNGWSTNFPVEYGGEVICEYDLFWTPQMLDSMVIKKVTDSYLVRPVVTVVPKAIESPEYKKWINGVEK